MRVLILSQWYAPEPDVDIHQLGRELAARGHHVTAGACPRLDERSLHRASAAGVDAALCEVFAENAYQSALAFFLEAVRSRDPQVHC